MDTPKGYRKGVLEHFPLNSCEPSCFVAAGLKDDRLIRLPELMERVGLSKTSVYERMKPTSRYYDPTFPVKVSLGRRARGWSLAAVLRWMMQNQIDSM